MAANGNELCVRHDREYWNNGRKSGSVAVCLYQHSFVADNKLDLGGQGVNIIISQY